LALDEKQIAQFMVIAWEIWKTRCSYIFSHTPVLTDKTIHYVQATTRDFSRCLHIQNLPKQRTGFTGTAHMLTLICCYVDGSFQEPSSGGTGYIITKEGKLIQFAGEGCTQATSVFHVECLSLLWVVQAVLARGIEQCTFLTDSLTLVHSFLQPRAPIRVQWQAYAEMHIWSSLMYLLLPLHLVMYLHFRSNRIYKHESLFFLHLVCSVQSFLGISSQQQQA
jgi:ribonuclease HI